MTQIGNVYGESLYELAKDENLTAELGGQLKVMKDCFTQEPSFITLLSTPSLSKAERCQILDDSFRGTVHAYVLNFLKILTEKGYMRFFSDFTADCEGCERLLFIGDDILCKES